jgi:nucleoside-diphosphate-sugar epimerase
VNTGRGRRALVTGGAGFIGGHIVEALLRDGWEARVLDDFSTGREANLADHSHAVEVLRGDIRDEALLARALRGVEVVFHEAAVASVPRSVAEPIRTNSINLDGTLLVLEHARRAGVRRVVFAASSAAYGDGPELPKLETLPPRPLSPYALQKLGGELYCRQYTALYGLETVALRYFNVFGPRQDPESEYAAVIPRFVSRAIQGSRPVIYGDGEQTRDFVYVGDAARANLLAADAERAPGSVINVAGGRRISLNQLWRESRQVIGCRLEPRYEPARAGDVRESVADVSRARELLGFEAAVDLAQGLHLTVEYFAKLFGPDKG